MALPPLTKREQVRESAFSTVWSEQLNDAFKNIAPYYDRGNQVASLGCWNWFLRQFMSMIELQPKQRVVPTKRCRLFLSTSYQNRHHE